MLLRNTTLAHLRPVIFYALRRCVLGGLALAPPVLARGAFAPGARAQTTPPTAGPALLVIRIHDFAARRQGPPGSSRRADLQGRRLFLAEIGNGGTQVLSISPAGRACTCSRASANRRASTSTRPPTACTSRAETSYGTVKIFDGTSYAPVATAKFSSDADNLRRRSRIRVRVMVGYGGEEFVGGKAVAPNGVRGIMATVRCMFAHGTGNKGPETPWTRTRNRFKSRKRARASS